ncbi:hypothetical protein [Teredinibacter turnerae]|uniref:hypothetical protein n=1 Tax=Teredinibacter turnerae TaxID=2426 RepID=UPI00037FF8FF|nr:hypothetical protein [Teredinibacter turnerae]
MRNKIIATIALTIGLVGTANAAKIFEYNDPTYGNYPASCTLTPLYGGGSGYTLWNVYSLSCPGHPQLQITRELTQQQYYTNCVVKVNNSNYYTSFNNCDNWRVYSN